MQCACAVLYCLPACPAVPYFPTLSNKRHDFRGGKKLCFDFTLQLLSETCLVVRGIQRYVIIQGASVNRAILQHCFFSGSAKLGRMPLSPFYSITSVRNMTRCKRNSAICNYTGCVSESGDFATLFFFLVRQNWGGCRYRHFTL